MAVGIAQRHHGVLEIVPRIARASEGISTAHSPKSCSTKCVSMRSAKPSDCSRVSVEIMYSITIGSAFIAANRSRSLPRQRRSRSRSV
jgi:hypothetical protein